MFIEPINNEELARISQELAEVTRGFHFETGRSAIWGSPDLAVAIDATVNDDGQLEHLVTVMAGLAPGESLAGIPWILRASDGTIHREGQTDRRGQFWLPDLESGRYQLQFEPLIFPLVSKPSTLPLVGKLSEDFATSLAKVASPKQFFSNEDRSAACFRVTGAGQWTLEVTFQPPRWNPAIHSLARFRIGHANHRPLVEGFIGLYDVDGRRCGQINLDQLDPTARRGSATCDFWGDIVGVDTLSQNDIELLRRCVNATDHSVSREALGDAIKRIEERNPPHGQ